MNVLKYINNTKIWIKHYSIMQSLKLFISKTHNTKIIDKAMNK